MLWDKMIGHKDKVSFIQEALRNRRLAQVLLFSGSPGVGKKLFALSICQSLICEKSRTLFQESIFPCGQCFECLKIEKMESEHIFFIHSNESEREIKRLDVLKAFDFLNLKNRNSLPRIVLIDKANKLNRSSSNTLLKILEEPPENSFIFLITDSFLNVLPTIRSRSQNLHFRSLHPEEMKKIVQQNKRKNLKIEPWMFQSSRGYMESLNRLMNEKHLRKKAFFSLKEALVHQDPENAFLSIEKEISDKEKSLVVLFFWQQGLRDAYVYKAFGALSRNTKWLIHQDEVPLIEEIGLRKSLDELQALFWIIRELEKSIFYNLNRALSFKNFFSHKLIRRNVSLF